MHLAISDSRRLTGPNLLMAMPGAILDVQIEGCPAGNVVAAWKAQALRLLRAVGWREEQTYTRVFPGGASLALSAPVDALYAATEVNEAAWAAAVAAIQGDAAADEAAVVTRLHMLIEQERNPALLRLREAARQRDVSFLADGEHVSVGLGTGSRTWPADALPDAAVVDWDAVHDIPVVLVTGTNGKSTTVRLLAAVVHAAGRTAGLTSTDFIKVGDEVVNRGDFSGAGGARTLLRHERVEVGVLEVARGGMLRRGLAVEKAAAALITNVAEDHLGEYGIETLDDLADAKFVVERALAGGGVLVLNADDPVLVRHARRVSTEICWFSPTADHPLIRAHAAAGGRAGFVQDDALVFTAQGASERIIAVADVPITLGGAARHNVSNSLGVVCLAKILGIAPEAVAEGLRAFRGGPADNPGRTNFFEIDGARVLVDFAHNPHGLSALADTVRRIPARRRLVMLGQAGDRSDQDIRNLAGAAWQTAPDHVVIADLPGYERGRAPGEVPALLHDAFVRLGAASDRVTHVPSCLDGVKTALQWAGPGDLLLLLVLTQRDAVFALLQEKQAR